MLFLAGFCIVGVSLLCCGCRSVTLSPAETQEIKIFAQKQTGEPVVSVVRQTEGNVQLTTCVTNGVTISHTWLLTQEPAGRKLTLLATARTSSTNSVLIIDHPQLWDKNGYIWIYLWNPEKRSWQKVLLSNGKSTLLRPNIMTIN